MGGREQYYVDLAFKENWIAPLGPNVDQFERDLQSALGQVLCTSHWTCWELAPGIL
jgi:dTDP-4-amino-4,6-dideoxygalactose transaminase